MQMKVTYNDHGFNCANVGQAVGDFLGLNPLGGAILTELVRWFGILFCFEVTNSF